MLRTLLLTSRAPWPPIGGDRLRTSQLATALSALGPVSLVYAGDEPESAVRAGLPFLEAVRGVPLGRLGAARRVGVDLVRGGSLQQALYADPALRGAVRERMAQTDVVVAHLLRSVPWVPADSPPLLVCLQDALAAQASEATRAPGAAGGWRRLAMRVEQPRLAEAELAAARHAAHLTTITARDRDLLVAAGLPSDRITVVPAQVGTIATAPADPTPDTITFLGNLRTASNQDMATWLARRILPMVRTQARGATLRICGVEAPPAVRALGELPGVTFVGPVDDPHAELARAWLTVCPLRFGSGVQNKVLESLAAGTPVVATPRVLETLHFEAVRAVRTGSHERALAVAIVDLLRDREARDALGAAGIAFVREHHGERAFAPLLARVRELAAG
mgnify:CR=1 FL=1